MHSKITSLIAGFTYSAVGNINVSLIDGNIP
ncbi:MAG: hypothetical protein ACI9LM_000922 [Alteromonadaceae bacterium]|jgi:hypothetical protein